MDMLQLASRYPRAVVQAHNMNLAIPLPRRDLHYPLVLTTYSFLSKPDPLTWPFLGHMVSQSLWASLLGFQLSCFTEKADDTSENYRRWPDTWQDMGHWWSKHPSVSIHEHSALILTLTALCRPKDPRKSCSFFGLWEDFLVAQQLLPFHGNSHSLWRQPHSLAAHEIGSGTRKHKSEIMGPESDDLLVQSVISEHSRCVLLRGASC